MTKEEKQQAVDILGKRLKEQRSSLAEIDARMEDYCIELWANPNAHNGYEILSVIRFLRHLRTYEFNHKKVRQVIKLREGTWQQDKRGMCQHVSGGLKQPLTQGDAVLRWEPFQVATLCYIFGPTAWIDTELTKEDRQTLLPTERINPETGHIEDLRRLCTNFTLFGPRKIDKTGIAAYLAQVFFLMEDNNSETYCCSNSADQSKILFRRIRHGLAQLDNDGKKIRQTETVCDWRPQYQSVRNSSIRPLSAGGKTKDGMFAQLCCADEYGSAAYTNGKCDMKRFVDVTESSMGPRREPLTITTTTAGRITTGPFIEKLESLHRLILQELKYDTGEATPELSLDRIGCICFEPDDWEKDSDDLLTSKDVRKKINPMLGKIVQHSFYDDEVAKARMDGDLGEVKSKLFNVYESATTQEWIKPDKIRSLQTDMSIDDCTGAGGWVVFCGLDFSQGDDLHTCGYLAARRHKSGRGYELFADFDAWVKQDVLEKSSIRPLYEKWIEKGFLHVSPGEVFQPSLFIQRFDELFQKGVQFQAFGFDPYQSKDPINTLKAHLAELGVAYPDKHILPVSQRNAWFNVPTDDVAKAIKAPIPYIQFSRNTMWPWLFGNCVLSIDGKGGSSADMDLGNKKPVKRNPGSDSCKVDPIQCIVVGMGLFTQFDGQNH